MSCELLPDYLVVNRLVINIINCYIGFLSLSIVLFIMVDHTLYNCIACGRAFKSDRSLQLHWSHHNECLSTALGQDNTKCANLDISADDIDFSSLDLGSSTSDEKDAEYYNDSDGDFLDNSLIELANEFRKTGFKENVGDINLYTAHVELIHILFKANAPLYFFDLIMQWARKCNTDLNVTFNHTTICTRKTLIKR